MSTLQDRQRASRAASCPNRGSRRTAALRAALEAQIEAAITALDALDGDADLEHTLGWSEGAGWQYGSRTRAGSLGHGTDDLEEASEDEGAQCEDEGAITGDDEPNHGDLCNWQGEGDQSDLRRPPVRTEDF